MSSAVLEGLSYDPKSDLVEVSVEGDRHAIVHPRSVYARVREGLVDCLEIVDGDEHKQLIQFRAPLALPG